MKVFFVASSYLKNFEDAKLIYKAIQDSGHLNTENFVDKFNIESHRSGNEDYWSELYERFIKNIAKSDVCIFETSARSIGIGQLIQESIRQEKPTILLLNQKGQKPELISGADLKEKKVQLLEYSIETIKLVIEYGLDSAKELLTTRFTMLMPAEYSKYLDEINNSRGISRSDYIRNLIVEDMQKNQEKDKFFLK